MGLCGSDVVGEAMVGVLKDIVEMARKCISIGGLVRRCWVEAGRDWNNRCRPTVAAPWGDRGVPLLGQLVSISNEVASPLEGRHRGWDDVRLDRQLRRVEAVCVIDGCGGGGLYSGAARLSKRARLKEGSCRTEGGVVVADFEGERWRQPVA